MYLKGLRLMLSVLLRMVKVKQLWCLHRRFPVEWQMEMIIFAQEFQLPTHRIHFLFNNWDTEANFSKGSQTRITRCQTITALFGWVWVRLVRGFKNWKLLFKNIYRNMCGWKSVLKCVKCCLKIKNSWLKTQTKHLL